jgi:hypothetical protein
VLEVMRLNREGETVPLVRESQRLPQAFSLVHNVVLKLFDIQEEHKVYVIYGGVIQRYVE